LFKQSMDQMPDALPPRPVFGIALLTLAIVFPGCATVSQPRRAASGPATKATSHEDGRGTRSVEALVARSGDTLLAEHIAETERALNTRILGGNSAQLLVDGPATHASMFSAIGAARQTVNLASYIIEADKVGETLADALIERSLAGIKVNVMYDSVGSMSTPTAYFDRLRDAGITVCEFNPVNPSRLRRAWRVNNRDHRKILVVDGRTGFAGGVNVSSIHSSGPAAARQREASGAQSWRDTHVVIHGPAVADLQRSFTDTWRQQGCPDLGAPEAYFPDIAVSGHLALRIVTGGPDTAGPGHHVALVSAFKHAVRRVYITCSYFVPDPELVAVLSAAAQRGVDVRLLLPSESDSWAPLAAGRSHYAPLLAAGVRIFERENALLHAKTAVVDGVWTTIGSTNLDFRSFVHNLEANVMVFDDGFAGQLEALFMQDLEQAPEITREAWSQRGPGARLKEWLARQFEYLL
jgi:cardiolipin synthase